jgi:hypothetical protein
MFVIRRKTNMGFYFVTGDGKTFPYLFKAWRGSYEEARRFAFCTPLDGLEIVTLEKAEQDEETWFKHVRGLARAGNVCFEN